LKLIQSNLVIRNVLMRNKLVLRNHFPWPIVTLLHIDKEHLALRNNFRVTKKFLITKFDCIIKLVLGFWVYNFFINKNSHGRKSVGEKKYILLQIWLYHIQNLNKWQPTYCQ
jgi:hypothetical protein